MFNLKTTSTKLAVQLGNYMVAAYYGFYTQFSLTTHGDLVFDSYFNYADYLVFFLAKHTPMRFTKLSDLIVYDRPQFKMRFMLNYVLGNPRREFKLRVRFYADTCRAIVPSVSQDITSSTWAEREAMDLFGVKFWGHPDLRRILGDYGLWGFPGRKDFPVVGQFSYFYSLNFLRVFRVKGTVQDFWSNYFQKKIYKEFKAETSRSMWGPYWIRQYLNRVS